MTLPLFHRGFFMKRIVPAIAALTLFSSALGADAACTLPDLAGKWTFMSTDGADLCTSTVDAAGGFSAACKNLEEGISYTAKFKATLTATCGLGGKVTLNGATFAIAGRVEQVTGALKPNTMTFRIVRSGVPWNSAMIGYRN